MSIFIVEDKLGRGTWGARGRERREPEGGRKTSRGEESDGRTWTQRGERRSQKEQVGGRLFPYREAGKAASDPTGDPRRAGRQELLFESSCPWAAPGVGSRSAGGREKGSGLVSEGSQPHAPHPEVGPQPGGLRASQQFLCSRDGESCPSSIQSTETLLSSLPEAPRPTPLPLHGVGEGRVLTVYLL